MKKYYVRIQISILLLIVVFFTSCNEQNKSQPKEIISEQKTITIGQPILVKTQGTDPNSQVQCGLQDKAGNLWFGTTGEGVYRYDARLPDGQGKSFTNFLVKDGLSSNTIWSILEDKSGNIWFGTAEGICRYDGKRIISIPITVTQSSYLSLDNTPDHDAWPAKAVLSMMQDKSGKIWFGTGGGVYYYDARLPDGQGNSFTYFLQDAGVINKSGLHLKGAERILEDKTGNIWFGGRSWDNEGVCRYDGKSITNFKPDDEPWVRPLLEDKAGNLWFGSRNHMVYRYDGKTFTHFAEKEITGWVFNMAEDKAGNLWFSAGKNGGVTCFDGKSFKNYTTKDGLSNNSVWCIVEDRAGNLWFGTKNTGLCRYDGKTFTNFAE